MNYYFITGTSRGIGKALAELLLEDSESHVTGISRSCSISHRNYKHFSVDLSNPEEANSFIFETEPDAKAVFLINNSAVLGEIEPLGKISAESIIRSYNVNLVSPTILMNNFVRSFQDTGIKKQILNVSSGAGRNAVDGWTTYCATKAGLDMVSRVLHAEQSFIIDNPIKIHSVAPGVIDTNMQDEIRAGDPSGFSRHNDFVKLKESGLLDSPSLAAQRLVKILSEPDKFMDVVLDVRGQ